MKKILILLLVSGLMVTGVSTSSAATNTLLKAKATMAADLKANSARYMKLSASYSERAKQSYVKSPESYLVLSGQMKSLAELATTLGKSVSKVKTTKQLSALRSKVGKMHLMAATDIRAAIDANRK